MNSSTSNFRVQGHIRLFGLTVTIGLVMLFAASEVLVRGSVLPQDDLKKHVKLFSSSLRSDAAFGDSHVARGFVPPQQMINLAYPSESIPQIDWKIRRYYATRKPGRIILQADPHMFAVYRLNRPLGDYPKIFEQPSQPSILGVQILNNRFRANLVNYWTSFLKNGGRLISKIKITENGAHLSPGDESKKDVRLRKYEASIRVGIHDIPTEERAGEYRKIYSKLLDFLADKDANVCMVSFPLSPDYREAMAKEDMAARDDLMQYFIAEARRTNSAYLNLIQHVDTLSKFRDTDHLNAEAAKEISPYIVNACFGDPRD